MKLLSWLWSLVIPNQESEIAKGMAKGAGEFLNLICKPAAEEYGLLLRDRVRYWRAVNTAKMLTQAQGFMATLPSKVHAAPPGIVNAILNEASWIDDAEVQSFWAGLLASACTEDGKDESNKIFINILKQMTALEVKIFSLACERAEKKVYGSGAIAAGRSWKIEVSELMSLVPVTDFHQLDRELDHMRQLGLLLDSGGIHIDLNPAIVDLTPSGLALQMYARCKGASRDPVSFYALTPEPAKTPEAGTAFKLLT